MPERMPEWSSGDVPSASRGWLLLRIGVRALQITASTLAVVELLRQHWVAAACFTVAWLLILQAPGFVPELAEEAES